MSIYKVSVETGVVIAAGNGEALDLYLGKKKKIESRRPSKGYNSSVWRANFEPSVLSSIVFRLLEETYRQEASLNNHAKWRFHKVDRPDLEYFFKFAPQTVSTLTNDQVKKILVVAHNILAWNR